MSGMNLSVSTLPADPESLKQIVVALGGNLNDLQERHNKETDILLEQIRFLRAQRLAAKVKKNLLTH